jgi:hypothetical protein
MRKRGHKNFLCVRYAAFARDQFKSIERTTRLTVSTLIAPLFEGPIDIVGDVHGEIDALHDLLLHLGYNAEGEHPDGRRLVFIGDLTDRGPDSPAVATLVSELVRRDLAQCVLGNHELNLLRQARKEGNGWHFEDNHDHRDGKFLTARGLAAENRPALRQFLEGLPVALERSDLRLVHAAWDNQSIAEVRSSPLTALQLYDFYDAASKKRAQETGLEERAHAERAAYEVNLKNPDFAMPLLRNVGAHEEFQQLSNPMRIITSGIERIAQQPFFASGKWRMADRIPWWDKYEDPTPVIIGHYWRWPTSAARDAHSRGEPDMFSQYASHHWFGAKRNVFCVDFAVGARYKERATEPKVQFECRLAAVRWPERELAFDDGTKTPLE